MMQQLLKQITDYFPLSSEAQNALHDCFEKITLAKNEYLLTEKSHLQAFILFRKRGLAWFLYC